MKIDGRAWRSLWEVDDRPGHAPRIAIIDQTRLPHALSTRELGHCAAVIDAIRSMQLRGAPLIGVAGAYGLALALRACASDAALFAEFARRQRVRQPRLVDDGNARRIAGPVIDFPERAPRATVDLHAEDSTDRCVDIRSADSGSADTGSADIGNMNIARL